MDVVPSAPRFTTEPVPGGIKAFVPSRRNWFVIAFLCAWLTGWAFGEVQVAQTLLTPSAKTPTLFLAAWLVGWTFGGAFALGAVVWQLGGKEIIILDPTTFEHRLEAFGLGWSRPYALAQVKNLRVTEYVGASFTNQAAWIPPVMGFGRGPLAFDYGAGTIRIGSALEEAEAKLILMQLETHLPRKLSEA